MAFSLKNIIKYSFIFYIVLIPVAPVFMSTVRLDYLCFLFLLCLLPFSKINKKALFPFLIPGMLLSLTTSYFIISGQIGEVSQLFINLFGFFRILVVFIIAYFLLYTQNITKEKLFTYILYALILLILIALIQSFSSTFNDILIRYYASSYKIDLFEAVLLQNNYRLTSTIGHPAGVGFLALILFAISINKILSRDNKTYQYIVYIFLLFLTSYIGIISGSKTFYIGIIIYLLYISFERKKILSIIIFSVLFTISLKDLVLLINHEQLTYVFNLINDKGFLSILETRFGNEGLLTTETIPYLMKSYFLGSGLFNAQGIFYGDNLYLMLALRFSLIGTLAFIIYFLYLIYKLRHQYLFDKSSMTLSISHIMLIMLVTGIGFPTLITSRVSELFTVLWAIGVYIINSENRKILK